jgi:DNA polymerase III epsilon subunit family exonuclease
MSTPAFVSACSGKRTIAACFGCAASITLAACLRAPAEPVTNVTFVAFDLETTGLSPAAGRIVEIGAVKMKNRHVLEKKAWLVNPGIPIPGVVQNIHGITDEMVKDAPRFQQVFRDFVAFAGNAVLLAHNASFDVRFIRAETERNNLRMPENRVLDTLALAKAVYPDTPGYSLRTLMQHLGSERTEFHRALADSENVATLFLAATRSPSPAGTLKELTDLCGGALRFRESSRER